MPASDALRSVARAGPVRRVAGSWRPGGPVPRDAAWWQVLVAGLAVAGAVAAVWVTLDAGFLRYPGWLAAQKADLILGPVFVGLYWARRRPHSRFGPMLIAFGFVGGVYVLQSSRNPWLFGFGVVWENVIYVATLVLILAFPTGRLDGWVARLLVLVAFATAAVPATIIEFVLPQVSAGASISGCRALCPRNALAITSDPSLALTLTDIYRPAAIVVALGAAALLIWRMATGTPPQRRARAIGTPIALVFLLLQASYLLLTYWPTHLTALQAAVRWTFVGARALIWYGFLFALIAAQLSAGRVTQRLVRQSLRRPSRADLEAMIREALGDPGLRLFFHDPATGGWDDPDGRLAQAAQAGSGRDVTPVERDGRPDIAILHDAQLNDDPELLQAAGAAALLAAENAELDAGWNDALTELQRSRARIVRVRDTERRRLERNLHDGVQQRLIGIAINLGLAGELASDPQLRARLDTIGDSVEQALHELREVSHGIYPPVLSDLGLVAALERVRARSTAPFSMRATGVGRYPAEVESAVYYCAIEAIQNAIKHGGATVHIALALDGEAGELSFTVEDDGPGFDPAAARGGMGLQNMHDRVGAVNGHLAIDTAPGRGTRVTGTIPLARPEKPR